MKLNEIFSWKNALFVHTGFFSLALLQESFDFGQLWFILNCFVMYALLRAAYGESSSNRLVAWYLYVVSIFTDILSLSVFGPQEHSYQSIFGFCLAMAILLLLPKPVFAWFLFKHLKDEGIDIRRGMRTGGSALADQTYKGVDTGFVSDNQQQSDYNQAPSGPGSFGGFNDEPQIPSQHQQQPIHHSMEQQHHQQQQQQQQQQMAPDEHDFMSNIPPPTYNNASGQGQMPQPDAPISNQYGQSDYNTAGNQV